MVEPGVAGRGGEAPAQGRLGFGLVPLPAIEIGEVRVRSGERRYELLERSGIRARRAAGRPDRWRARPARGGPRRGRRRRRASARTPRARPRSRPAPAAASIPSAPGRARGPRRGARCGSDRAAGRPRGRRAPRDRSFTSELGRGACARADRDHGKPSRNTAIDCGPAGACAASSSTAVGARGIAGTGRIAHGARELLRAAPGAPVRPACSASAKCGKRRGRFAPYQRSSARWPRRPAVAWQSLQALGVPIAPTDRAAGRGSCGRGAGRRPCSRARHVAVDTARARLLGSWWWCAGHVEYRRGVALRAQRVRRRR